MSDWTTQAADLIDQAVATVRDKTVVPSRRYARLIVVGMLAAFFGLCALVVLVLAMFRLLVIAANEIFGDGHAYVAHLLVGAVFVAAGMFMWTRRATDR
jgi:uncharacterized membrane protein